MACSVFSFAGACTRFLESWSHLSTERSNDIDLLALCSEGKAAKSNFMRSACLNARSSKASPLVFKAGLRAVGIAYDEFTSSVSSPSKLMVLFLFIVSSFFLPISSWIRSWSRFVEGQQEGGQHHVVFMGDHSHRASLGHRITGALQNRRRRVVSPKPNFMDIELLDHDKWA